MELLHFSQMSGLRELRRRRLNLDSIFTIHPCDRPHHNRTYEGLVVTPLI